MVKILLICSSPMLSLRLSMFLQDIEGLEFSIYRNLDAALPLERNNDYDFVIVGSYLDEFDDTARVSEIKTVWRGAKTKIILIADLDNPKQKICQRTVVNDVVYLFWHFRNRTDIRKLIDDSLKPELKIEKAEEPPKPVRSQERVPPKAKTNPAPARKPLSAPTTSKPKKPILKSESSVSGSEKTQKLKDARIYLSNIERLKPAVVVIASSTGGFAALRRVVSTLPDGFRAPIVIAQHMPKGFEETLVKSLNASNENITVLLAGENVLESKHIYVVPYDYHAVLRETGKTLRLTLNQEPKEHSLRPAADPLFRSVAKCKHHRVVAAILTGMGSDGTLGGKEIKNSGGIVICQDQESSAVWGMPRMAVETGICDKIVALSMVGPTLFELTK